MNVASRGLVHALASDFEARMAVKMTRCGEFIITEADRHKVLPATREQYGNPTDAEADCMACLVQGEAT